MNYKPATPQDLKEGLECQIIDMRACADELSKVGEIKKHFKRDFSPNLVYKDHILTAGDIQYYELHPELIQRDILIKSDI